jgi:hypothetical protein
MMSMTGESQSKLGVLEDLIKYMRKLELAKDEPKDALAEGLGAVEDKMSDEAEGEEEKPSLEIEIGAEPKEDEEEMMMAGPESEETEEELSPFQQKMKDYFNDTDKPKMGSSMSFMVASKKPGMKMEEDMAAMPSKKKRGRPFKNR